MLCPPATRSAIADSQLDDKRRRVVRDQRVGGGRPVSQASSIASSITIGDGLETGGVPGRGGVGAWGTFVRALLMGDSRDTDAPPTHGQPAGDRLGAGAIHLPRIGDGRVPGPSPIRLRHRQASVPRRRADRLPPPFAMLATGAVASGTAGICLTFSPRDGRATRPSRAPSLPVGAQMAARARRSGRHLCAGRTSATIAPDTGGWHG